MADASSASSFILATNSLAEGFNDYSSLNAQGDYTRAAYETNARYAEMQADEVVKLGYGQAKQQRKKTKQFVGAQRAALAAQGVEVNSGSGLQLQEEAMLMGADDARTIEMNAFKEAWGLKSQASEMGYQGKIQQMSNRFAARGALIAGVGKSIGYGSTLIGNNKIKVTKIPGNSAGSGNAPVERIA